MKESTFVKYIAGKMPASVHSQSMTFGSRSFNGTPDRYFDGKFADLWVEFKYVDAMPRDGLVGRVDNKKRGCYSTLQYDWMLRRWTNGGNVLGIIALPNRTAVIQHDPEQWRLGSSTAAAIPWLEVAKKIEHFCIGELREEPTLLVGRSKSGGRADDQRRVRRSGVSKRSTTKR